MPGQVNTLMTAYEHAEAYVKMGISVIPVTPGTKEPPVGFRWSEYTKRIADASERYEWFIEEEYDIAVISGPNSGNLVVLDFDGRHGYKLIARDYPQIKEYPRIRTGSGKTHVWIWTHKPIRKFNHRLADGSILEVRAGNHISLAPPSSHPDGGTYRWVQPPWDVGCPIIDIQELGLSEPKEAESQTDPITEGEPLSGDEIVNLVEIVQPAYKETQRHNLALSLAAWLAHHSVPENDAREIMQRIQHNAGEERDTVNALPAIRDTYRKARKGITVAGWSVLSELIPPSRIKRLDLLLRSRWPELKKSDPYKNGASEHIDDEEIDEVNERSLRFQLIPFEEYKNRKPPPQLIQGILARDSTAMIFGESGAYKSFLALDLALHVANGLEWNGYRVETGHVIYVAGEGAAGLAKRIKAWEIAHGYGVGNAWMLPDAVQLPDPHEIDSVLKSIEEAKAEPTLIVIDTLARSATNMDENTQKDMGLVIDGADRLRKATGAIPLMIHHTNRQGLYRGSSSIKASMDTMLEMKTEEDHPVLYCYKQKDIDIFPPIHFEIQRIEVAPAEGLRPADYSIVLSETSTASTFGNNGMVRLAWQILGEHEDGLKNRQWLQQFESRGGNERAFYRAKKYLMERELATAQAGVYKQCVRPDMGDVS